jgi:hypothetical protein
MHTRIIPAAGALWEAVRYILLAMLFTLYFNRELSGEYSLFFLWITSAFAVMLAALLLAAARPQRYGMLAKLVGGGKALQFLSGLLLFLYEQQVFSFLRSLVSSSAPSSGITHFTPSLPAIAAVTGIDLIFAFLLLLYSPARRSGKASEETGLPRTQVTEVEER